ncbi:MAG TPA: PQQ-binding-like beta-propeller repeat protein [Bryobacteraceae bacterium]|nr:PQQ-binding-like beta-propeller repeat protein [Bryobacteraceae bacterium]
MPIRMMFFAALLAALASGQEWPTYAGDLGGRKYSPLKQINRENVDRLHPAWIFHTGDWSDGTRWPTRSAFEATPLVVNGIMYVTTPFSRVIALDAETGREIWSFDPRLDRTQSANLFINRGAAWWSDGHKNRVFLGTLDGRLFSVIAETGKPDDSFGLGGWVDLRKGIADDFPDRRIGMTSPPLVYKNLVICGSLVPDGEPRGPAGDVRAYDTGTGKLIWTFHTVARAGEFGNNTWAPGSWEKRGGANAWPPLTVDAERGILFLPLTSPSTDFYGGDRKGAGLFGDSLVAVDAATGRRLWHFQTVHHNLWDYDLPAQPTLVQVRRDGKIIDAVAQVTKTGFTFIFDRVTGQPIFPIEEVPVPRSDIPGEDSWPTQPRPTRPPPYARQTMTADELTDVTPESHAYCGKLIEGAEFGHIFSPNGLKPTVIFPGTNGGANWGGASYDPETRTLYVNSMDVGMLYHMVRRPDGSEIPYRQQGSGSPNSRFWDPDLNPCQKPPWGFLTAIDLDSGTFRWRSVLGVVDKLLARGLPPTGSPNIGGSLVTAGGLVFIGATNDSRFRAFDKDTGKELWVTKLPASAHATPMTFRGKDGRQFVVIAAGGGNKYNKTYSDSLMAFALPTGSNEETLITYSKTRAREGSAEAGNTAASAVPELFDHKQHASLKIKCAYCHKAADTAARAGFPTVAACMTCHQAVATDKPDIQNLAAMPASEKIAPKAPVYRLPDFVFFRHDQHVSHGIACTTCHGDVWSQAKIQPVLQMKMKACVDCHQVNHASVTCTTCHELSQ